MEGSTGYDTEFTVAGEPVPTAACSASCQPTTNHRCGAAPGTSPGVVVGIKQYTPPQGRDLDFWGGITGTKIGSPIAAPWLSLADLNDGDQAVWVGRGNADGSFDIAGVPDGDYPLTWWDEPQNYILNLINVTVRNGETVEMGNLPLNGWWTEYEATSSTTPTATA